MRERNRILSKACKIIIDKNSHVRNSSNEQQEFAPADSFKNKTKLTSTEVFTLALQTYIRCVGNKFSQENILVAVQRVDNNIHQPGHLSLELKLLCVCSKSLGFHRLTFSACHNYAYEIGKKYGSTLSTAAERQWHILNNCNNWIAAILKTNPPYSTSSKIELTPISTLQGLRGMLWR